ncbi:MAG: hypothetical protein ACOH13_09350 [Flavobacteriales bacterium]
MKTLVPLLALMATMALCFPASAQSVRVVAFNAPDSVILRWAPVDAGAWRHHNQHGYVVERMRIGNGTVPNGPVEMLTPTPLKPLSLDGLKARFAPKHPYAPVVAQALYGKTFAPNANPAQLAGIGAASDELVMRWSFCLLFADMDAGIADAQGLRFVDHNVQADALYLYRVISLDSARADTAVLGVNRMHGPDAVPQGPLLHPNEKDGSVQLRWDRSPAQEQFSAYWIERALAGGSWKRMNARPYIPMDPDKEKRADFFVYEDSVANYTPYEYRLAGITSFGMESAPSPVVRAMGRDLTAPPSPEMKGVKEEKGKLVVRWEQPAGSRDLAGFRVERSEVVNGVYYPLHTGLLSKAARSFTDTSTFLMSGNHYHVIALDTAGNASVSLGAYGSTIDSVPPLPPVQLRGSIDTNGVVTVEWEQGKEMDLLGYRVFFANATDHTFNTLTPTPIPMLIWHDTIPLRTLTKDIHYKVVAVDRSFNHSAFSAMLTLHKPDRVAPVSPVIAGYVATDSMVTIRFIPSGSDDVKAHNIYRRSNEAVPWNLVAALPPSTKETTWTDTDVSGTTLYAYAIEAIDSTGNVSERTPPLRVRVNARVDREAVTDVQAIVMDENTVAVRWKASDSGIEHYVIYRTRENAALMAIGSVTTSADGFTDVRLPGKGAYIYSVKAVHANGAVALPVAGTRVVVE